MKSTNPTNLSDLHQELLSGTLGETYIKSFSQRTGEQAGQLVADFLTGILFLFLVGRLQGSVRSLAVPSSSELAPAVPPKSEILLTAYEIAIVLNISKAKAYQLLQRGEIPAVQFDRTTRVRKQDLGEFIRRHVK